MKRDAVDIPKRLTVELDHFLPYGRQYVTDDDIAEVVQTLRSDFLTQGQTIPRFEQSIADFVGSKHVVACANGTAALHLAMLALRIQQGDIVVTSPITFVASANCARYVGADVRFVDIDPATGLMDLNKLADLLTHDTQRKIKAVIPVHFAGQPVDLAHLSGLAKSHGAWVVDDACHALGARHAANGDWFHIGGSPHVDLTVFSFHPVKHVATGEGGAIATSDSVLAKRLEVLRTHGISRENVANNILGSTNGQPNPWYYEMQHLGYNYRLTDIQASLGIAQMRRLQWSVERRTQIAQMYRQFFAEQFVEADLSPLDLHQWCEHSWHLFVLQIDFTRLNVNRSEVMNALRAKGIGTQVHYIPVHLQPYYRTLYGHRQGDFPAAEQFYDRALSIPMYPTLSDDDVARVTTGFVDILKP